MLLIKLFLFHFSVNMAQSVMNNNLHRNRRLLCCYTFIRRNYTSTCILRLVKLFLIRHYQSIIFICGTSNSSWSKFKNINPAFMALIKWDDTCIFQRNGVGFIIVWFHICRTCLSLSLRNKIYNSPQTQPAIKKQKLY